MIELNQEYKQQLMEWLNLIESVVDLNKKWTDWLMKQLNLIVGGNLFEQ